MLIQSTTDEEETRQFAVDVALVMSAGDLLFLSGDLGAGKTVIARGIVRQLADNPNLEVPSPTYTLCHHYETTPPIAHYDLYRLSGSDELDELGWAEQLEDGCAVMEWPERCFEATPVGAVAISISMEGETGRRFQLTGDADFLARIARSFEIRKFLNDSGKADAKRQFLSGDASTRSYEIINDGEMLLMNSPKMPDGPPIRGGKPYSQIAHLAEDVSAFVAIDQLLREKGVRAPEIYASDFDQGLLLTENFGSSGIIDDNRNPISERYLASTELLAQLHGETFPEEIEYLAGKIYQIPRYDDGAKMIEVDLLKDWYLKYETGQEVDGETFAKHWQSLFDIVNELPHSLVLRDYHSPNILWCGGETGIARVGVIDFQDAVIGPEAYDVASLAQDARVDISEELEQEIVDHYIACRIASDPGFDVSEFKTGYAIMAAQRATKILGIFVRLDVRDGKPQYRTHIPRIREYLKRSLGHPVMKEYREWLETVIEL